MVGNDLIGYFAEYLWLIAGAIILMSINSIKSHLYDLENCFLEIQYAQLLHLYNLEYCSLKIDDERLLLTSCGSVANND